MGNTNHLKNEVFMNRFVMQEQKFKNEDVIFHVEDIQFPLSTDGMRIVDKKGKRVKLAGTNWSGGHAKRHCVAGLDRQPLQNICKSIRKKLCMNVIRLTFSLQLYFDNNVVPEKLLSANPELVGKKALDIFDHTIETITSSGLMVLLNNHTSKSQWCCSDNDGDGLWWSKEYSEEKFVECLVGLAERYKDNKRVIGMDLRNEIRKANGIKPTWGTGDPKTDWKRAAQLAANRIHQVCPHWLVVIGGLNYQLDLTPIHEHPIKLQTPNKLVYSGHLYSFSWGTWVAGYWRFANYEDFKEKMFNQQLFVRGMGVPFILGEFGENTKNKYWNYLIRLLRETDIDWTYWCVDGYKCDKQQNQTYGLLNDNFRTTRYGWMINDLKSVAYQQQYKKNSTQVSTIKQSVQKSAIEEENKREHKQE